MAELRLPFASYLDAVREEADRLAQAAEGRAEARLPACPQWAVADLVAHLTGVYRCYHAQVEAADPEQQAELAAAPRPAGEREALDGLERAAALLVQALEVAGPGAPCWNWTGSERDTGWVARRMALESALRRVDAELAGGTPHQVEAELAADGLEERIALFLARGLPERPDGSLGGSLCLVASDLPAAFVVEVVRGRLRWRAGRGPADAAVVGTASQLFLFAWNRLDLTELSLTGRLEVVEAWRGLPA